MGEIYKEIYKSTTSGRMAMICVVSTILGHPQTLQICMNIYENCKFSSILPCPHGYFFQLLFLLDKNIFPVKEPLPLHLHEIWRWMFS